MKNILVTGGAGFIGSNFVRYLLEQVSTGAAAELQVVNLDVLSYAGSQENFRDLPAPIGTPLSREIFATGNWWKKFSNVTRSAW